MSLSNRILEAWPQILRMSHAIVSARYSAKIQVRCVAVKDSPIVCLWVPIVAKIESNTPPIADQFVYQVLQVG